MTTHIRIIVATWVLVTGAALFHASVNAQNKTASAGIFSAEQAKRGMAVYNEQCASCHGEDMAGVAGLFPGLAGADFVKTWESRSVGEFFEKVATTMPALDPGSLKPEQNADVVAYILSYSKYPAGAADLATSAEPLKQIQIGAPQP